jgi:hypothetical protein
LLCNAPTGTTLQKLGTHDLLCFPALLERLRELDYPRFEKTYDIPARLLDNDSDSGLNEYAQFINYVNQCHQAYKREHAKVDAEINNLLYWLGSHKTIPRFEGFKVFQVEDRQDVNLELIFNGMSYYHLHWMANEIWPASKSDLYELNPSNLLNENKYNACRIEGGYLNTPIMKVYVNADTWRNKGHSEYLNLMTGDLGRSKIEATALAKSFDRDIKLIAIEK